MSHERNGSPRSGGGAAAAVSREVQEAVDGLRHAQDGVKLTRDLAGYFDRFADAFIGVQRTDHVHRAAALEELDAHEKCAIELLIEHRKVLKLQIDEERARAGLPRREDSSPGVTPKVGPWKT